MKISREQLLSDFVDFYQSRTSSEAFSITVDGFNGYIISKYGFNIPDDMLVDLGEDIADSLPSLNKSIKRNKTLKDLGI